MPWTKRLDRIAAKLPARWRQRPEGRLFPLPFAFLELLAFPARTAGNAVAWPARRWCCHRAARGARARRAGRAAVAPKVQSRSGPAPMREVSFSFCLCGCGFCGGSQRRIFLVARLEPDVGGKSHVLRVGLHRQVAHADHRGAGAELVEKIHQLVLGGEDVDVLDLLDRKSVV